MARPQIVWFRQDLRTRDQAALRAAAGRGPVLPVYVLDDETPGAWRIGGAQRWWLHHSLEALGRDLSGLGAPLALFRGRSGEVISALAAAVGGEVHALRHYEPWAKTQQNEVGAAAELTLHDGLYLKPPGSVTTGSGGPFRVFTPFWRALQAVLPPDPPAPAPARLARVEGAPAGERLADWGLLPTRPNWATGFDWTPGEAAAHAALAAFAERAHRYAEGRNLPSDTGTSRLSPYLHHGEVSPAAVWHALADDDAAAEPFRREIGWRDFSIGLIDRRPESLDTPDRDEFRFFPHRDAPDELAAWQAGRTGYPIVDAGMRQLWTTGWMHNRVRMVASSFLVKHLLIDWRDGSRWFWDTLVDADAGNNTLGWQWIMGSAVDPSPYIRVFAPVLQSRKFEAAAYIRRWVPELAGLDDEAIHAPWEAGGVKGYPAPIVDHAEARRRALAAYQAMRK